MTPRGVPQEARARVGGGYDVSEVCHDKRPACQARSGGSRPRTWHVCQGLPGLPGWSPCERLLMSHLSCYIQHMAVGHSGRLVFEVEPALKRELHARVATEGRTLKDWLIEQAEQHLRQPVQEPLPFTPRETRREATNDE
jgi:hypothetical protein